MTNNPNTRVTITFNANGNVVENNQFLNLSSEQRQQARDFANDIVGTQSTMIDVLVNGNAFVTTPLLVIDPVILDLNGDGVKLTSYNNSEVTFYIDNDGKLERTGWVKGFKKILRTVISIIFCIGIFIELAWGSPEYWPVDDKVVNEIAEFSKSRTKIDITTNKLIEQIIKNNNLDPAHKSLDQCELMNKITTYIGLNEISLGSNGSICAKNNEACIIPYRIVKSKEVYKNGFYEDDGKFNSELIHLVTDFYGRPIGISRLFTKSYAKNSGYYQILQHHRQLPESNNSLQEIVYSEKKPDNGSYLKIDRCYIKEIHLVLNDLYIARPVRYNQ